MPPARFSCCISKASNIPRSNRVDGLNNAPTEDGAAAGATNTRHQNLVMKASKPAKLKLMSCLAPENPSTRWIQGEPGFHCSAAHRRACSNGYLSYSDPVLLFDLPTSLATNQRTLGTRCPHIPSLWEGHCSRGSNERRQSTLIRLYWFAHHKQQFYS